MAIGKFKPNTKKSQIEKNSFSDIIKTTNRNDFILKCSYFCHLFNKSSFSIWTKNHDPLCELKKQNVKNLSIKQTQAIYFLHSFFKKEKPVFFRLEKLAQKLDLSQSNVSRFLSSLENKNIISKINWKTGNKGHGYKVMLLPSSPNIVQKYIKEGTKNSEINEHKHDFLKNFMFVCNSPKLLKKNQSFLQVYYKLFIYTNISFNYFASQKNKRLMHDKIVQELKPSFCPLKEEKPMRYNLKRKTIDSIKKQSIKDKFAKKYSQIPCIPKRIKNIIEVHKTKPIKERTLNNIEIRALNQQISLKYNIDLKTLFPSADKISLNYEKVENKVRLMMFELLINNIDLDFTNSDILIDAFNNIKNKRFSKTQINIQNKTYLKTVIALTYQMSIENYSVDSLLLAIKRLNESECIHKKLLQISKINFLLFVSDIDDKSILEAYTKEDTIEFKNKIYARKSKYEESFKKFKYIFIDAYYKKETGERNFKRSSSALSSFLDNLIDKIKYRNLNLCGYKLTVSKNNNLPLLKEYLMYIQDTQGKLLTIDIVDNLNWINFVNHKMRNEYGYKNFFYPIDNQKAKH